MPLLFFENLPLARRRFLTGAFRGLRKPFPEPFGEPVSERLEMSLDIRGLSLPGSDLLLPSTKAANVIIVEHAVAKQSRDSEKLRFLKLLRHPIAPGLGAKIPITPGHCGNRRDP